MTKFTTRDGLPFTFELACTDALINNGIRLLPCWLFTLVDIHLGVTIDAVIVSQEVTYPAEFGPFWKSLDFTGEDTDLLTISVPDSSVLTDDELAALPWGDEVTAVRRQPGQGLHPVHEEAIEILLACSGAGADPEGRGLFQQALEELQSYSLFEHVFDNAADLGYRPDASYRQARTGDANDPHTAHAFDPWCCGLARLQALQTLRLTPGNRRQAQGSSDHSQNGA